ncbi:MAG: flagellar basal body-associated FliL family protein [Pseudomonadota bacterium]
MRREEMTTSAKIDGLSPAGPRKRVRTPGKHIVLFTLAVTFMLALSTTALQSGKVKLPSYDIQAIGDAGAILYSPSEEFLIDLSPDATGRSGYLKLTAKLVAKDRAALTEIKDKEPMIRERVTFFLREMSAEDFAGSEAMARLKGEILKRASLPLSEGAASDIVIEDIVIQ